MKSSLIFLVTVATLVVVRASGLGVWAQDAIDPRIAAYDKGPDTIDISTYPAGMKAGYKLFVTRCSKCHTIARAINAEFVLEDEWERYVKRMMRKPGSGISANDGKTIYEFLAFDSKTRKKALYDKRSKGGE